MARPTDPTQPAPSAPRHLLETIERLARADGPRPSAPSAGLPPPTLLGLHLSRAPGLHAHHRRIAAALLGEAAERGGGQLHALGADMALLFSPADGGAAVVATLARVFATLLPPETLCSLWPLPAAADPALVWLRCAHATTEPGSATAPDAQASAAHYAALDGALQSMSTGEIVHRQTAVLLRPGHADPLVPAFREVAIATTALEARLASLPAASDPFLFSHLATRLDQRMLAALLQDVPAAGPLSAGTGPGALHVNLTLPGALSEGFARLATAAAPALAAGLRIGIELPFAEIFADPTAYVLARERIRLAGMAVVLDGLTADTLALTAPETLEPDLVKLSWSASLLTPAPPVLQAIARLNGALGHGRLMLHRIDDESAIGWGMRHGIVMFQGRYIDTVLAAARLRACPQAKGCTLRACLDRAAATDFGPRGGCRNLALLDLGAPLTRPATPPARLAA